MQISVQKMTILTFLVALAFAMALPAAKANTGECEDLSETSEILHCLNEYGLRAMGPDGPAQAKFEEVLHTLVKRKYDIDFSRLEMESLLERFTMENRPYPIEFIDTEYEYTDKEDGVKCFDFDKYDKYGGSAYKRKAIQYMKRQVDEIALFLGDFHAKSLGKQSSLLFPLIGVQICNTKVYGGAFRRIMYANKVLLVGENFGVSHSERHGSFMRGTVLSKKQISKEWKSGEIMRRSWRFNFAIRKFVDLTGYLPVFEDYQTSRDGLHMMLDNDVMAVIMDRVAKAWMFLDPIGEFRRTIRFEKLSRISKIESTNPDYARALTLTINGINFPEEQRDYLADLIASGDNVAVESIYKDWKRKMYSPLTLVQAFESSFSQSDAGAKLVLVARSVEDVGVNVMNAKTFDIDAFNALGGVDIQTLDNGSGEDPTAITTRIEEEEYYDEDQKRLKSRRVIEVNQNGNTRAYVNADRVKDIGVNVDLIDEFDIGVGDMPSFSAEQVAPYALVRAIKEHMRTGH